MYRVRTLGIGVALMALLLGPLGCATPPNGANEADEVPAAERVPVVATTSMLADLVRQIGGDRVAVSGLMGPGVDPHLYKPSEGDVMRMVGARLVVLNGLHLEGRMGDAIEQLARGGIPVLDVGASIPNGQLRRAQGFAGAYDPHIWMDVSLWKQAARTVAEGLGRIDPGHVATYQDNLAAYTTTLDSLDAYVRRRVEAVPSTQRVLITAHDAFGYFGRAYGFEVRGLQGLSTAAEAGIGDVQDLAGFIATHRIPALFVESSVPPRTIEAVQAAVRERGFNVRLGGTLYSDALGGTDSGADTYEGMMRHNVETIASGLGG